MIFLTINSVDFTINRSLFLKNCYRLNFFLNFQINKLTPLFSGCSLVVSPFLLLFPRKQLRTIFFTLTYERSFAKSAIDNSVKIPNATIEKARTNSFFILLSFLTSILQLLFLTNRSSVVCL